MRPDDKPCLRELVAAAINSSNLSPSDLRETNVDRIGALAFADPLGGALWALKWAGEARAYPRALEQLLHRTKRACGDFRMRAKLCRAALSEWLVDLCTACDGRGSLLASDTAPVRQCETCHGSGKRKISEVWRSAQIGLDVVEYRRWAERYVAVQQRIVDAEASAWFDIAHQLGRGYQKAFDEGREAQVDRVARFRAWVAAVDSGARLVARSHGGGLA